MQTCLQKYTVLSLYISTDYTDGQLETRKRANANDSGSLTGVDIVRFNMQHSAGCTKRNTTISSLLIPRRMIFPYINFLVKIWYSDTFHQHSKTCNNERMEDV